MKKLNITSIHLFFFMGINLYAAEVSYRNDQRAVASLLSMLQYDCKQIQADMINQNNMQILVADQLRDIASSEQKDLILKESDDRERIILDQVSNISFIVGQQRTIIWNLNKNKAQQESEASFSLFDLSGEMIKAFLIFQEIWG